MLGSLIKNGFSSSSPHIKCTLSGFKMVPNPGEITSSYQRPRQFENLSKKSMHENRKLILKKLYKNLLLDQHPSRTFACRQTSLVLEYHFGEPFGFGCDWCDSWILPLRPIQRTE